MYTNVCLWKHARNRFVRVFALSIRSSKQFGWLVFCLLAGATETRPRQGHVQLELKTKFVKKNHTHPPIKLERTPRMTPTTKPPAYATYNLDIRFDSRLPSFVSASECTCMRVGALSIQDLISCTYITTHNDKHVQRSMNTT